MSNIICEKCKDSTYFPNRNDDVYIYCHKCFNTLDVQLQIAKYTMVIQNRNYQILLYEYFQGPKITWRPSFVDLLIKYMAKFGYKIIAQSSSGNGLNVAKPQIGEDDFISNTYIPLRPEKDNFLPDLEKIIINLAEKNNQPISEIMENIFLPLAKAEQSCQEDEKIYDDKSLERWEKNWLSVYNEN